MEQSRKQLFRGRRKGRALRPGRQRLLDKLLPHLKIDLSAESVDPAGLFACAPRDVWLEVGFGGGEHLAEQARTHPDTGMIGCEPFINGVAKLLSEIDRDRLDNIRIHPDDARDLIDRLPDASIGRAFVLFADPWPKARHSDRRFIGPENLDRLARVMKDGAELRIASDQMPLIRWMLFHTTRHPDFEWSARGPQDWRSRPADWPATRYEAKAVAKGIHCIYLTFHRRTRGGQ
jgi:tRNA (guanine-N7-)-methyltransferase